MFSSEKALENDFLVVSSEMFSSEKALENDFLVLSSDGYHFIFLVISSEMVSSEKALERVFFFILVKKALDFFTRTKGSRRFLVSIKKFFQSFSSQKRPDSTRNRWSPADALADFAYGGRDFGSNSLNTRHAQSSAYRQLKNKNKTTRGVWYRTHNASVMTSSGATLSKCFNLRREVRHRA